MTIQYLIDVFELGTNTQLMTNVEFEFSGAKDDLNVDIKAKEIAEDWLARESKYSPRLREKLHRDNKLIPFRLEIVRV